MPPPWEHRGREGLFCLEGCEPGKDSQREPVGWALDDEQEFCRQISGKEASGGRGEAHVQHRGMEEGGAGRQETGCGERASFQEGGPPQPCQGVACERSLGTILVSFFKLFK